MNTPLSDSSGETTHTVLGAFHNALCQRTENGDFAENCSLSKVNVVCEASEVGDF